MWSVLHTGSHIVTNLARQKAVSQQLCVLHVSCYAQHGCLRTWISGSAIGSGSRLVIDINKTHVMFNPCHELMSHGISVNSTADSRTLSYSWLGVICR